MMRAVYLLAVLVVVLSCKSRNEAKTAVSLVANEDSYDYDTLRGHYAGTFAGANLSIVLTYVSGKHALGYDLHNGVRRNISGKMMPAPNGFSFALSEPGDNPADGQYTFTIDTNSFVLAGSWTPNGPKGQQAGPFQLTKGIDSNYDFNYAWDDTIGGTIVFEKDGKCVYEYYPDSAGKPAQQLMRATGTWTNTDSTYTIDWAANNVFRNKRSLFRVDTMVDTYGYKYPELRGDERLFRPYEGP